MNWIATFSAERAAPPYLAWLRRGGVRGAAVWPGGEEPDPAGADALLLAGGGDIAPSRYGATAEPETANVIESRDEMEFELVRLFIARRKPVFGICRGIQVLNVALGGGLIQHVPRLLAATAPDEIHSQPPDGTAVFHGLEVLPGPGMGRALHGVTNVNTSHHQALVPERLAPGFRVVCLSPAGIIEAVESASPDGKLSAVQWHPERLPTGHPASRDLLRLWIETASGIQTHDSTPEG